MAQAAELAELGVKPASALTREHNGSNLLPVLDGLHQLLPRGLTRGTTVAITPAIGATSLLFGLLAGASCDGSWCAIVGIGGLGLAAAAHTGIALERLAVVPNPGPHTLAVTASLLDGFDIVALAAPGITAAARSQLSARARITGSVLVPLTPWTGANLTLTAEHSTWYGRGRLRCRRLTVTTTGRGAAAHPRRADIWLPDDPAYRATLALSPADEPEARLRVVR